MNANGKFVISLDFELMWGVRDKKNKSNYGDNILAVWEILPRMLDMFEKYDIKATFATVGFLFASNKEELVNYFPIKKLQYSDPNLSPYNGHFEQVGETEKVDKYHFASELIKLIQKYPDQEVATHTFSHYYCLEAGQDPEDFREDLIAAKKIAEPYNEDLKSLVFPRNQFNRNYLDICRELGITSYRGNVAAWFYSAANGKEETLTKRAFRLLDAYVNISGDNIYCLTDISKEYPFNIPASQFLRPYSPKLKAFEPLRLRRILKGMEAAAKKGKVYHLWWHPHNFGSFQDQNFSILEKICLHYKKLNSQYKFESATMKSLSEELKNFVI